MEFLRRKIGKKLGDFAFFLKKLYDLTKEILGSSYIISNIFLDDIYDVYSTLTTWKSNFDIELRFEAKRMKDKYDKYWGSVEK
ncbi:hypothetical protein PTKIN_Ptkin18bG0026600 [Pterospermum kingtungense]